MARGARSSEVLKAPAVSLHGSGDRRVAGPGPDVGGRSSDLNRPCPPPAPRQDVTIIRWCRPAESDFANADPIAPLVPSTDAGKARRPRAGGRLRPRPSATRVGAFRFPGAGDRPHHGALPHRRWPGVGHASSGCRQRCRRRGVSRRGSGWQERQRDWRRSVSGCRRRRQCGRGRARGLTNFAFVLSDLDSLAPTDIFDALIGRYVLQWLPDPSATLAALARHVRPGGIVVFHEPDWGGSASHPTAPLWDATCGWVAKAIRRSGAETRGTALWGTFEGAGLGRPTMRLEAVVGAGGRCRSDRSRGGPCPDPRRGC